jgi:RNA polymerase sigma-70 factor (ECF subfamily)
VAIIKTAMMMKDLAAQSMTVAVSDSGTLTADFESVVRTFRPVVFRFALASLRDRDAAETIAQDCFLKAFNTRDAFRGECAVKTWLMQIAVNLIRDHIRNRKLRFWRRAKLEPLDRLSQRLDPAQHSPEAAVLSREQIVAMWSAVERLPEKQRCVFLLRFVEDMDILEIVTATGMKEGTVKTHLFRSLGTIRKRMEAKP